jgi:hypothetical protein
MATINGEKTNPSMIAPTTSSVRFATAPQERAKVRAKEWATGPACVRFSDVLIR